MRLNKTKFTQVAFSLLVKGSQLLALHLRVEYQLVLEGVQVDQGREVLASVGVVGGWRVDHVQGQFEGLLHHVGDDAVEQGAGAVQAGVRVDFDQPGSEILVYHEVEPENLEVVHLVPGGDFSEDTLGGVSAHLLHLWQNIALEVILLGGMCTVQVSLEFLVGNLVVGLIASVFSVLLLNRVIGQVDLRLKHLDLELVRGCPDVALGVPVGPHHSVQVGYQHVVPDVELAVVVEQGSVNVHLHNVGANLRGLLTAAAARLLLPNPLYDVIELVNLVYNGDAPPLVGVLARLNYPDVAGLLFLAHSLLLLLFLFVLDLRFPAVVIGHKPFVLGVLQPFLNVESKRDYGEDVLADQLVVLLEVIEKCFFIAEIKIVLQMVMHQTIFILIRGQNLLYFFNSIGVGSLLVRLVPLYVLRISCLVFPVQHLPIAVLLRGTAFVRFIVKTGLFSCRGCFSYLLIFILFISNRTVIVGGLGFLCPALLVIY